jgi:hypothetical protein
MDFDLDAALRDPEVLVRVLTKPQAKKASTLSDKTWERIVARGEGPPVTQLSDNRVGYRLIDFMRWLDARRRDGGAA